MATAACIPTIDQPDNPLHKRPKNLAVRPAYLNAQPASITDNRVCPRSRAAVGVISKVPLVRLAAHPLRSGVSGDGFDATKTIEAWPTYAHRGMGEPSEQSNQESPREKRMSRFVCKFGGSSVADANQFKKVHAILESDPRRSIIVPSAPGKRTPGEAKLTDLLYLCHKMAAMRTDFASPFSTIRERFFEIEAQLGLPPTLAKHLDELNGRLQDGCTRDFVASRGEYLNGLLMAQYLGATFIDPQECVFITSSGLVDPRTYEVLGKRLTDTTQRYVIPGFYGRDGSGNVKTFSRGGSDISGAIAARAAHAELYENWTDVSGLLMTDPRVVDNPRPMEEVTYREIRELSYMGASVFHDEAILPVREVDIPICIKNTNAPEHPGTRIVPKLSPSVQQTTEIAGIAGKRNFSMICIEKSLMNKELGFAQRVLGVFGRNGVSFEHCPSSIDGFNVIAESSELGDKAEVIVDEIQRLLQPDRIELVPELALIAVVGEGMTHRVGIAAKAFCALRDADVNVRVINQGASEFNIIIGVAPEDYERAMRALYEAYVPGPPPAAQPPSPITAR